MSKKNANSWTLAQWTLLSFLLDGKTYTAESLQKKMFSQLGGGQFDELVQSLLDAKDVEIVERVAPDDVDSLESDDEPETGIRITPNGRNLYEYLKAGDELVASIPSRLAKNWLQVGDTFVEDNKQQRVTAYDKGFVTFDDGEVIHVALLIPRMHEGKLKSLAAVDRTRYSSVSDWWNTAAYLDPELPIPSSMPEVSRDVPFDALPEAYQEDLTEQNQAPFPADGLRNEVQVPADSNSQDYSKTDPFPNDLRPELVVHAPELGMDTRTEPAIPSPESSPPFAPSPEFVQEVAACPVCHNEGTIQGCPFCHRKSGIEETTLALDSLADALEEKGDLENSQLIDEAGQEFQAEIKELEIEPPLPVCANYRQESGACITGTPSLVVRDAWGRETDKAITAGKQCPIWGNITSKTLPKKLEEDVTDPEKLVGSSVVYCKNYKATKEVKEVLAPAPAPKLAAVTHKCKHFDAGTEMCLHQGTVKYHVSDSLLAPVATSSIHFKDTCPVDGLPTFDKEEDLFKREGNFCSGYQE
ncbi:MAG: hypothetical protein WC895_04390 [Candidatus Shapirobacteria bacterium]|jgi:hypothetical protein